MKKNPSGENTVSKHQAACDTEQKALLLRALITMTTRQSGCRCETSGRKQEQVHSRAAGSSSRLGPRASGHRCCPKLRRDWDDSRHPLPTPTPEEARPALPSRHWGLNPGPVGMTELAQQDPGRPLSASTLCPPAGGPGAGACIPEHTCSLSGSVLVDVFLWEVKQPPTPPHRVTFRGNLETLPGNRHDCTQSCP